MSYPNQQYPPQPQQPAPQAPYPPAPQAPYPPQQGYAQPQQQYPQQGYAAPAPQAQAPRPPAPKATMADYLDQPAMSGASLQFNAPGDSYTGIVARDLDPDADFPAQTERDGVTPKRFRDGRIMVRMVVPLNVRPDQRHPDGKASLSVQGQMSEALKQQMSAVGAGHLRGVPEAGAEITVTWVSTLPPKTQGFSGTKIYGVIYKRPAGAAAAPEGNGQQAQEPAAGVTYPGVPSGYEVPQAQQPPWEPPAQAQAPYQPAQPQFPGTVPPAQFTGPPAQFTGTQVFPDQAQPAQFQQGPPAPQMPAQPAMAGPAEQVASATQAGVAAAQASQPMTPPPGMPPYTAALMKQATGQQLTGEDQAALAAGPPQ